ncbi:hypothetical protein J4405_01630 [Candidatus Woesearchaeota archaeon]|nr:hypothetical protein [Candidatus Woesearchaeota archaeon]
MLIISEQDIINTYNARQQEQCRLYYEYKKIKQENTDFGYKRIAKLLGHSYGKTRWWHAKKHLPIPIQTAEWLKSKNLIPLYLDNEKLPLIAKILGATFGDGGIDKNLNMIFLSSSEMKALEDFKLDLINLFGKEIETNFDIRIGGINKTSHCIRNTNRNIIRFFKALNAPIGNKTKQEIFIPKWIELDSKTEDQFYFSFFGSEVGIPRCRGGQSNSFDIAIGGSPEFHTNRLLFMEKIKVYISTKGINSGKISINTSKSGFSQNTYLYRLLISTNVENMLTFLYNLPLNYCYYKTDKLKNTIDDLLRVKRERFVELKGMYRQNDEKILRKLNIKGKEIPFRAV